MDRRAQENPLSVSDEQTLHHYFKNGKALRRYLDEMSVIDIGQQDLEVFKILASRELSRRESE